MLKNKKWYRKLLAILEITLGVFLLDLGFFFFYTPADLVTGGGMGIALIINETFGVPSSVFMYAFNIITLFLGLFLIGKSFFLKTIYASLLSPTLLLALEKTCNPNFFYDNITEGRLIICALCGAVLVALGLGLCFRNNGCTGGMDVIQKILCKYFHMPLSKTMYLTDWTVVIIGGLGFKGAFSYNIEHVVYGVIAVILTGYIVDNISMNAKSRRTAYIITTKPDLVKEMIFKEIERGVTLVDCKGGYTGDDKTLVICTLDKDESYKLADFIKEIDKNAFTFMSTTREVVGYYGDAEIKWLR